MTGRLRLWSAVFFVVIAAEARGQGPTITERAGFQAIILTPVGALTQIVHVPPMGQALRRFRTELVFSRYSFTGSSVSFQNVGLSARIQAHRRLSFGATLGNRSCSDCEGVRMAGADVQADVWHQAADESGEGRASLAFRFHAGYGEPKRSRFNARSLTGSLPVAVTLPQSRGSELTLFFTPALAYGYISDGSGTILGFSGGDGTVRVIVGAGLGYQLLNGLGLHAALHKIVIDDSPTQFGIGASWSFGKFGAP